ncbi:MAG: hypothetical protein KME29_04950 [Calothrix sp. FI2-JRJ7]|jgi:hypothetical protein|nr:hypothetical protein [Calothrix sp. FI2-JRJ7]
MYKEPTTKMTWFGAAITIIGAISLLLPNSNFKRDLAVSTLSIGGACLIVGGCFSLLEILIEEFDSPRSMIKPRACIGCKFYHGQCGINCAVHPEGAPGIFCKDWEGINNQN